MNWREHLRKNFPDTPLLFEEPMSGHTTFGIGGPADCLVSPRDQDEFIALLAFAHAADIEAVVIGNGSNLLVSDLGVAGLVVKTLPGLGSIKPDNGSTILRAGAGVTLARLAQEAVKLGLTGLEFAHGIPGTVGGAVAINAGAYGGEMKDVVTQTRYLDAGLLIQTLVGSEHDFSYRHSYFASHPDCFILDTCMQLKPGDPAVIKAYMADLAARRRDKQPLDWPSAGSAFKRPASGYAAEWIERAGFKGFIVGGAMISDKHAGFIINRGGATCGDVLRLMEQVRQGVRTAFGIELEPEIRLIGRQG